MKSKKPTPALVALTAAFLVSISGYASATESIEDPVEYCAILVGKTPNGATTSPVLARACSQESPRQALEEMEAKAERTLPAQVYKSLDRVRLMTWFEDANYGGNTTEIYGDDGPCDTGGYRVEPDWFWKVNLTSVTGTDACDVGRFYTQQLDHSETRRLPTHLYPPLNDNVGLVRVWNG